MLAIRATGAADAALLIRAVATDDPMEPQKAKLSLGPGVQRISKEKPQSAVGVMIRNDGSDPFSYNVSVSTGLGSAWASISEADSKGEVQAQSQQPVDVALDLSMLPPGVQDQATIVVRSTNAETPVSLSATLNMTGPSATRVEPSRKRLRVIWDKGATQPPVLRERVSVFNTGAGLLRWRAFATENSVDVSPTEYERGVEGDPSGGNGEEFTVTITPPQEWEANPTPKTGRIIVRDIENVDRSVDIQIEVLVFDSSSGSAGVLSLPPPQVRPTGLIFTDDRPQDVEIRNRLSVDTAYYLSELPPRSFTVQPVNCTSAAPCRIPGTRSAGTADERSVVLSFAPVHPQDNPFQRRDIQLQLLRDDRGTMRSFPLGTDPFIETIVRDLGAAAGRRRKARRARGKPPATRTNCWPCLHR